MPQFSYPVDPWTFWGSTFPDSEVSGLVGSVRESLILRCLNAIEFLGESIGGVLIFLMVEV